MIMEAIAECSSLGDDCRRPEAASRHREHLPQPPSDPFAKGAAENRAVRRI